MEIPTVTSAPAGSFLLDVREDDEWAAGHAPQAVHIPLGELVARIDEVPRDRQVVAVCHSGGRSARATAFLCSQGVDAVNFAGGMLAWAAAGAPMQSSTGAPPVVY
ncbi:MAG TPA: rhodanese-like domain-containing protein [Mycobacteriales bacterium]|jgi:rhodanese-related sulfurtransferase|nr:rhodanese-like domain-containing protein [Mycobacteriales bacterium]